ncbi:MAG: ABC transporter substrate-binding protein [Devosia sp.]
MKKLSVAALAVAALLGSTAVQAADLNVVHWWTSGGESAAVSVFAKEFDAGGDHWVDGAIADGATARAAIMQRVLGGDPPGAAQFNPGREYEELINNNLLLDLADVAERDKWNDVIRPAGISAACHVDGHWWCVPVNIHSWNWAWASIPAFKAAGLELPKSFDEFLAGAPKLKEAGIIPFAIGGGQGGWQVAGAFGVIQTAELGLADREKLLKDKDEAVAMGESMTRALTIFKGLKQFTDDGYAPRNWNDTTALVVQDKAAIQIMGDWARGEFGVAGEVAGTDYDCLAMPIESPTVSTDGDVFVFPKQGDPEVEAAQKRLAALMISPRVQALFNNAKGSMPVRDDVDMSLADACMKKGLEIIKNPANIQVAGGRWLNEDTNNQINALMTQFFSDDAMTVAEAQQKYWDILKNAQ